MERKREREKWGDLSGNGNGVKYICNSLSSSLWTGEHNCGKIENKENTNNEGSGNRQKGASIFFSDNHWTANCSVSQTCIYRQSSVITLHKI